MFNRITIIGNLGKDPEMKYTQGGKSLCRFSVATTEKWTDGSGQAQERTEWHQVTTWGKQAEACQAHLAKGSKVFVEGRLQSREYEKDGVKHRAWEINATNVVFLSYKNDKPQGTPDGYEPTNERFPEDIPF